LGLLDRGIIYSGLLAGMSARAIFSDCLELIGCPNSM
jgi:hypothetical protein